MAHKDQLEEIVAGKALGHWAKQINSLIRLLRAAQADARQWISGHGIAGRRGPARTQRRLEEVQLAEDHPGRGKLFKVYLGVETPANHGWYFEHSEANKYDCIDWRCCASCGLPYPEKCATGTAQWRRDGVLQLLDLDCCAPTDDYYCSGGDSGS